MKILVLATASCLLFFLLPAGSSASQCSEEISCPNDLCCSKWGYCGSTDDYCGDNCINGCSTPSPAPPAGSCSENYPCSDGLCCSKWGYCGTGEEYCGQGPSPAPPGGDDDDEDIDAGELGKIITKELFDEMLKHRNDTACPAKGFYTYSAFVKAAKLYPEFGTTGDEDSGKREIAAFFAQTSHETTGGWPDAPDGPYAWGYCFIEELGRPDGYCDPKSNYKCVPGQNYFGRGPMQLSWNYNYGQCGEAINQDLLSNADLVATDNIISFETAIWFWMTPQWPKPSCHDVILGNYEPSANDIEANRLPGFGLTTNIINGGLECSIPDDSRVKDRIGFYLRYCKMLGVDPAENLDCETQRPFGNGPLKMVVN